MKKAILVWASNGEPYAAADVRRGIATKLGVTPEMQSRTFGPHSAMTIWDNYDAHGLSTHSRPPEVHTLGNDGYYRLTEHGKIEVSYLMAPKLHA